MAQYDNEKLLAIFYPLILGCGFICSVTSAVAWQHWKYVMDTCVEVNCGCILKGISTITYFTGGHVAYCYWATFGLVFSMFMAVVFGCYHVYRVCLGSGKHRRGTHTIRQRSTDVIVMTTRAEMTPNSDASPYWWVPSSINSFVMVIWTLVHAGMYLDGFLQTCRQYRTNDLIRHIRATGPMVAAIQGRLSCSAVFDFMDYIHPDVSFDRRRIDRINTPACLIIALITAWATVALWIAVCVINVIEARKSRKLRV